MKNIVIIILVLVIFGFYAKGKFHDVGFRFGDGNYILEIDDYVDWYCFGNYGVKDKRSVVSIGLNAKSDAEDHLKVVTRIRDMIGAIFGGPGVTLQVDNKLVENGLLVTIKNNSSEVAVYWLPYTALIKKNQEVYDKVINECLLPRDQRSKKASGITGLLLNVSTTPNWQSYKIN